MSNLQPLFSGEMLFRRWSDSSTQGVQVTFALADASELEPLKAKAGKRFACVLVEIGDDETPVQEPTKPKRTDTRGPYCREACDLCADPQFQKWASLMGAADDGSEQEPSEALAKAYVLACCRIDSRKDLDALASARGLFIQSVRVPFMHWQRKQNRSSPGDRRA